jgi:hypothetical protein
MDIYLKTMPLLIGSDGIAIEGFLAMPIERWIDRPSSVH